MAEKVIFESNPDNEYLPFKGLDKFTKVSGEFAFGKSKQLETGNVQLQFHFKF